MAQGLPLADRHLVITSQVQEQQLAGAVRLGRRHLDQRARHVGLVRTTASWRLVEWREDGLHCVVQLI